MVEQPSRALMLILTTLSASVPPWDEPVAPELRVRTEDVGGWYRRSSCHVNCQQSTVTCQLYARHDDKGTDMTNSLNANGLGARLGGGLAKTSLREQALNALRNAVTSGEIVPGTHLVETELS